MERLSSAEYVQVLMALKHRTIDAWGEANKCDQHRGQTAYNYWVSVAQESWNAYQALETWPWEPERS